MTERRGRWPLEDERLAIVDPGSRQVLPGMTERRGRWPLALSIRCCADGGGDALDLRHLVDQQTAELFGRAGGNVGAEAHELRLDVRHRHDLANLGVELV